MSREASKGCNAVTRWNHLMSAELRQFLRGAMPLTRRIHPHSVPIVYPSMVAVQASACLTSSRT